MRLLLLAATTAALLVLLYVVPFEQFRFWGWDVAVFRAGSNALIHGANPYDPQNVVRYSDGAELASIPYYIYSPIFAVLIAPLALVPPEIASRLWFVFNLAGLLGASLLLLRELNWQPSPGGLTLLALGLAAYPPTRTLLLIGQSTGLMLLLLVVAVRLNSQGRQWLAGAALGLAFFKPHLLLVPPFLLLRRQWRMVAALAATLILTTLPFFGLLDDWIRAVLETRLVNLSYGCVDFSSFNMLLQCLGLRPGAVLAVLALPTVASIWLLRSPAHPGTFPYVAQLGLMICLAMIVIDNVRVADLVLLVFPVLVVLQSTDLPMARPTRLAVIGLLLAAFLTPYLTQIFGALSGSAVLYSLPIWYASVPISVFVANSLSVVADMRSAQDAAA